MNSLMSSWILWSPNHMNIWIGKCRFLQALGSCVKSIDKGSQNDRKTTSKSYIKMTHYKVHTWNPGLANVKTAKQRTLRINRNSGRIWLFQYRNLSKDRWPSENDIKTHRCYNSFCAINLVTIDLRSICIKASDGFHVVSIKKTRTCSLYLHLMIVWRLPWWSIHAGSMENWCRFHGGFM